MTRNAWAAIAVFGTLCSFGIHAGELTIETVAGPLGAYGDSDGNGSAARFNLPHGIAVDASGNVYVSDLRNHLIRRIDPKQNVMTLAGLSEVSGSSDGHGGNAQFDEPFGLALDSSGNLFVADSQNQTIRKITPGGNVSTLAGLPGAVGSADGAGSAARFNTPRGLAIDAGGNLYVADALNHIIRKVSPSGVVSTIAGVAGTPGLQNGPAASATFNQPSGVAVDTAGVVYVADTFNQAIRTISNGTVGTLAGGAGVPLGAPGPRYEGAPYAFNFPAGITAGGSGTVYVADTDNHTIVAVDTTTGAVAITDGVIGAPGSVDGSPAQYNSPVGIAFNGSIYVADTGNSTIRKITLSAVNATTTLAGLPGAAGYADATGLAARFNQPTGACMDGNSNLIVCDPLTHVIRQIAPDHSVTTLAGTPNSPGSSTGFPGQLNGPNGVSYASNFLYIADTNNHAIRTYDPKAGLLTYAGQPGTAGSADGSPATTATFNAPMGVFADGTGTVFVADSGNHSIRSVSSDGVFTTAGSSGTSGSADGQGASASFNNPTGIVGDGTNLYVADTDNHTIRMIDGSNNVTTIAGLALTPGAADGPGSMARFSHPSGLTLQAGVLFVSETDNHTIRAIDLKTLNVTTVAGLAPVPGGQDGTGVGARFNSPAGLASDGTTLFIVDSLNNNIRAGLPVLSDTATIDQPVGIVQVQRQLGVSQRSAAAAYQWTVIRRPVGSVATFNDPTLPNPVFTPDVADLYVFQLMASGSGASYSTVTLTALPPLPVITSPTAAAVMAGQPFTYTITANNNPDSFDALDLPPGLNVDKATGIISGTPTQSGTFNITLEALNMSGTGSAPLTLTVSANLPPVITLLSTQDNPALLGTTIAYTFSAADADTAVLYYAFSFGDSGAITGSFAQGTAVVLEHVYTTPGIFTVSLTVSDGLTSVTQTALETVPAPASGGQGVSNISTTPVTNPLDGLTISVMSSDGGVIQLNISIAAKIRDVFGIQTDWGDVAGRSAKVPGPRPVHQYIQHGIFVAKSTVTNITNGTVAGMGRKMLTISTRETGEMPPNVRTGKAARELGIPPSSAIVTTSMKGKFIFSGAKNDTVSFSGSIQLPAGLNVGVAHEFIIGIGNIIVDTTVDKHGKGAVPGTPATLKSLKITYPKIKNGTVTAGGEVAKVAVTFNTAGMVTAGFDTEGISRAATDVTGGQPAPRSIQVAMLLDGVPYETLAPVSFSVSKNADFGTISGRSGK